MSKNIEDIYTLSSTQQGLLYHALHAPHSAMYYEQFHLAAIKDLDIPRWKQTWRILFQRHPILRTSFHWTGLEKPVQVVHKEVEPAFIEMDLKDDSPETRQTQLDERLTALRREGFAFDKPSQVQMLLVRMDDDVWHFILCYHHILMDGWSLFRLVGEMRNIYKLLDQGQPLPEPVRPYRDFISWQRGVDLDDARPWWTEQLAGFEQPTPLPGDQRPQTLPSQDEDYDTVSMLVDRDIYQNCREFARGNGLTFNTMVQAAWALILNAYSKQMDLVYGTTITTRPGELSGSDAMVGLFINTLPVRVGIDPDMDLLPWLQEIQEQVTQVADRAQTPAVDVQRWSSVAPGVPLFESLLLVENFMSFDRDDVVSFQKTNYPLLMVVEPVDNLLLWIGYDTKRFNKSVMMELLDHFSRLLAVIIDQRRVRDLLFEVDDATAEPEPRMADHGLPLNEAEQALADQIADLWGQVLQRDEVSLHQDFFEQGGDSVMSIQLLSRMHKAGLQLDLATIFERRTIAAIARHLLRDAAHQRGLEFRGASS